MNKNKDKPQLILILAPTDDYHAKVVTHALLQKGHKVLNCDAADFPEKASLSFKYKNDIAHAFVNLDGQTICLNDVDVVWQRRPFFPTASEIVVEQDKKFVQKELTAIYRSLYYYLENAFWVNSRHSREKSDLKPYQLLKAQQATLNIPETIITNEPEDIREFLQQHNQVIYKPLTAGAWEEEGKSYKTYTSIVTLNDCPKRNDLLLRSAPGIFQKLVEKQYEVRAQFFGKSCFAVTIDSHSIKYGEFDWRLNQRNLKQFNIIELPTSVYDGCLILMADLGLVSGVFDFIVTPDNDWIYLEVNEAGQFLFLEDWCPNLPILDAFCSFLVCKNKDFTYLETDKPVRFSEIKDVIS